MAPKAPLYPTPAWGHETQTKTPSDTQGGTGRGLHRRLGHKARDADRQLNALNSRALFIEPERLLPLPPAAHGAPPCLGPRLGSPTGCPQIPSSAPHIYTHPPTPGGVGDGQGCLGNEPRIGLVQLESDGSLKIAPG